MKTNIILIALLAIGLSSCGAQSQTTVYAKNSDISDNLDLRAVASMFGESANLQDFERRLNDPKYQISNLDLNGDDEVDYLRVIESVEDRTHVVIIQAVLDRDVFQDIATIDVERDNSSKVVVQVVGNSYLYGDNYIYEPVYSVAPVIYSSFWVTNYRPYYSTWGWNYYPTYYTAWSPYPVYRYRNNVNVCINVNNHYNYVNTRRSYRAPAIYETRRSYGYEKMRPNNSFEQRHSNVNNRYELDQRRVASRDASRNNSNTYNTNRPNSGRTNSIDYRATNRNYTENRTNSDRTYNTNRVSSNRDNNAQSNNPVRVDNGSRTESRGNSTENRPYTSRGNSENTVTPTQRTETPRSYSDNRPTQTQRTEAPRSYSENRPTQTQRTEAPRGYSENRGASRSSQGQGSQSPQRSEAPRASQESRSSQPQQSSQPQRESGSRGGGRRG
jgi:hypothetical protein